MKTWPKNGIEDKHNDIIIDEQQDKLEHVDNDIKDDGDNKNDVVHISCLLW